MSTALDIRTSLLAPGDALLRLSLRVDAVVTGVNGLAYLALSGPIESLLGLDRGIGIAIGVFLLAYAVAVAVVAAPSRISGGASAGVIAVNAAWVVGSVIATAGGLGLTAVGVVWAVLQALVVGVFATLQYLGLRRAR
ncbi:hypothetical protein [Nocardia brevicatena]|uniref:hypothetical protein n=1 Tax=Nocardia brevicatena TaxID=37327 RepID=UPI0002FE698D|nr:hypothetical protein [Nocardia brevicatena]